MNFQYGEIPEMCRKREIEGYEQVPKKKEKQAKVRQKLVTFTKE